MSEEFKIEYKGVDIVFNIEQGDRTRPEPQVIIIRASVAPGAVIEHVRENYNLLRQPHALARSANSSAARQALKIKPKSASKVP
jgi:hypothetical protein